MIDSFGNYLVQKLLDVCTDDQLLQIVLLLTNHPTQLVRISLNTHGYVYISSHLIKSSCFIYIYMNIIKHFDLFVLFVYWVVTATAHAWCRSWSRPSPPMNKFHWWSLPFNRVFLILLRIWMEITSFNVACNALAVKIIRYNSHIFSLFYSPLSFYGPFFLLLTLLVFCYLLNILNY